MEARRSSIEDVDLKILEFFKTLIVKPRTAKSMAKKAHDSGRELMRALQKIHEDGKAKGKGDG